MKNSFYIYIDQPFSNFQMEKTIPKGFKIPGYQIKILSSQNISFSKKQIQNYFKKTPKHEIPKNIHYLNSIEEFKNFLKKKILPKDIIFLKERSFNQDFLNNYDLKLFKQFNAKTIWHEYYPIIKSNFSKNLILNSFRSSRLLYRLNKRNRSNSFFEPNFFIGTGDIQKKEFTKFNFKNTKYFDTPSIWIKFFKKVPKKKNFIIYVDENVIFSREDVLIKKESKRKWNKRILINDLNLFFKKIEKIYNSKVIISCSKKYVYKKNYFNNRKIVYGKTLDLISSAKLVIGHQSDALYQAIYTETPVVLLKHKTFGLERNLITHFKSVNVFNKYPVQIEKFNLNKIQLNTEIDKNFYRKILRNYFLSKGQKTNNFSKIFIKKIKNIVKNKFQLNGKN